MAREPGTEVDGGTDAGDDELEPAPAPPERDAFDRLMRVVYAGLVVAECVYLADVLSHGAVSRVLDPPVQRARARIRARLEQLRAERDLKREGRWVVFEAVETARDAATNGGNL